MRANVLLTILLTASSAFGAPWNITKVGDLVSDYYLSVVGNGEVAFAASPYGLLVVDVSDRAEPRVVRRIETAGNPGQMALRDSLLYFCDGYMGLKIYSIADPLNPELMSECLEVAGATQIRLRDTLAFVNGRIVDISDPYNPIRISSLGWNMDDVAFMGDLAYSSTNGIQIFDISDPYNPARLVGVERSISGEIVIEDSMLYSAASIYSLKQDPMLPEHIFGFTANNRYMTNKTFEKLGSSFLMPVGSNQDRENNNLYCFNIEDPAQPSPTGRCRIFTRQRTLGNDIDYDDGWVYVSGGENGLSVVDFQNFQSPRQVGLIEGERRIWASLTVDGDYAYAIDRWRRLSSISLQNPSQPRITNELDWDLGTPEDHAENSTWCVKSRNGYLYEIMSNKRFDEGWRNGIFTYSLEDPSQPRLLSNMVWGTPNGEDNASGINSAVLEGDYIFATTYNYALIVVSLEDPENPRIVGDYTDEYRGFIPRNQFCASGDLAIGYYQGTEEANFFSGIIIWDISNPFSIERFAEMTFDRQQVEGIAIGEGYAYLGMNDQLILVDISNPEEPEIVNTLDFPLFWDMSSWIKYDDGHLFVKYKGIQIYSLEDPLNPVLTGYYDTPNSAYDIATDGNRVVVADMTDIGIYDISRARGAWYIDISSERIEFPDTFLDSLSQLQLEITNVSNRDRTIDSIMINGGIFQCSGDSSILLSANGSVDVDVSFQPIADSVYTGSLSLWSNGNVIEVALSGKGVVPNEASADPIKAPLSFSLQSVFPNPFNSQTHISYDLPITTRMKLAIYDVFGREVAVLVNTPQPAGYYRINWNADDVANGLYFCRMEASGFTRSVKMLLVK